LRRRNLPVLAVIGCAALTTVGASASSRAAGPRVVAGRAAHAASAPTTPSNRQAAVRDAQSLLSDVVPPAGAVLQSSGTAVGSHAHLLTEALASAVADSTWTVPADPADVLASVEGDLPPGSSVVGTGSGGQPPMQSVTRAWPPVPGVLQVRWLEIAVTALPQGGTQLYAESQSEWVVTRPTGKRIPSDVRQVSVTDGWPGSQVG
jgi:hypothetical protein